MPHGTSDRRWEQLLKAITYLAVAVCGLFLAPVVASGASLGAILAGMSLLIGWEGTRSLRAYVTPAEQPEAAPATEAASSDALASSQTPVEEEPAPAQESAPDEKPARQDAPLSLAMALARSDDALATLRDLALQDDAEDGLKRYGTLPKMLRDFGIETWHPEAKIHCTMLPRNHRFWLAAEGNPQHEELLRMASLEMTLNVWQDVFLAEQDASTPGDGSGSAAQDEADARTEPGTQEVLSRIAAAKPVTKGEGLVRRADDVGVSCGEWRFRLDACDFLESIPTPYRTEFELHANLSKSLAVVDMAIPVPEQFAPVTEGDARSRCITARTYAFRTALLAGRAALQAARGVSRAVVNCRTAGSEDTLLSLNLDSQSLQRLLKAAEPDAEGDPLLDPAVRSLPRGDGWLMPVTPFEKMDSKSLRPSRRYTWPELDDSPTPDAVRKVTAATLTSELGTHQDAKLVVAWNQGVGGLGGSTKETVAAFVRLKEAAGDRAVADACDRACAALVDGRVEASDYAGLAETFVHGTPLHAACMSMDKALEKPEGTATVEHELAVLLEALAPYTTMATYMDDTENVYRHFDSTAERVRYNLTHGRDKRHVVLVPDAYYVAQFLASRALGMLGRHEEALEYARELVRLAPCSADALLVEVRELEELSRTFESEALLVKSLDVATSDRELAVCYYRLAYMEWKLGRNELSLACYQYAIVTHPAIAPQAIPELQTLMASDSSLHQLAPEEVEATLKEGSIPFGMSDEKFDLIRNAAAACTDAGLFAPARSLVGELLDFRHDDVVADVYRSLASPEG